MPPQYIPKRLAAMNRELTLPAATRGDCPGYLFHFLTGTPFSEEPGRREPSSSLRKARDGRDQLAGLDRFGQMHLKARA